MTPLDQIPMDPDVGTSTPTPAGDGWLDTVNAVIAWVPSQVWVTLLALVFLASLVTFPIARRQARKAGARAAGKTSDSDRRDRALFIAAIIPASMFLVAVLAGSQRGLVAFGRDDLHWHDGWEFLVPATLDGVGLAFAFLAFRAVRKESNPDRAVRVAWGAAAASAAINFFHESNIPGGSTLGGAYLALLSMFVMVMFHELLDQFTEGTEYIRRANPAFKLRWLTWPSNTVCAWVAWRNYPVDVDGDVKVTVKLAVEHLDEVRAAKRSLRQQRVADGLPPVAWWTPVAPWVRLRQVDAALAVQRTAHLAQRAAHLAQRADWEARVNGLVAERHAEAERFNAALAEAERQRLRSEHLAEQLEAEQAERTRAEQRATGAEDAAERARSEAERLSLRLRSETAEQRTDRPERPERSVGAKVRPLRAVESDPSQTALTDAETLRQKWGEGLPERGAHALVQNEFKWGGAKATNAIKAYRWLRQSGSEQNDAERSADGDDTKEHAS